jgi:hypothetical protein
MKHSARIFNCARCHCQVIICSCCDRGNIYCGPTCASASRKESLQAAGERYQQTYRGRMNHAKRQKQYRERQVIKVTHLGSPIINNNDLLPPNVNESIDIVCNDEIRCHFCGCVCDSALRIEFLAQSRTTTSGVWPLGP